MTRTVNQTNSRFPWLSGHIANRELFYGEVSRFVSLKKGSVDAAIFDVYLITSERDRLVFHLGGRICRFAPHGQICKVNGSV